MLRDEKARPGPSKVAAFRNRGAHDPLGASEIRFLALLGIHLTFLPWALGNVFLLGQIISLGLSCLGFIFAYLSFAHRLQGIDARIQVGRAAFQELRRFPPFWIGLILLLYLLLQAGNPSWMYVRNASWWWLVKTRNLPWLPTSIEAPFLQFNVWRQFIIYADAWILASSLWLGPTSRRSLRIILGVLFANAAGLALLLAIQHAAENIRIPWPLTEWTNLELTASFANKNYAGAYLALLIFPGLALMTWFIEYKKKALRRSTPAGIFALGSLGLALAVFFTLSRGAALTMMAALALFGMWFLGLWRRHRSRHPTNWRLTLAVGAIFGLLLLVLFQDLNYSEIFARMDQLAVQQRNEPSVRLRILARSAAVEMFKENGVRGVGAGGFRFLFIEHAKKYPDIYRNGLLFWEHAHCDWLEIPIELGIVGDLVLAAGGAWWLWIIGSKRMQWSPIVVPLLLGCFQTLIHAAFDFPFQCPAILLTWIALLAVAGKWAEFSFDRDRI